MLLKVIVTVTDDFQFQYKKILIWTPNNCHCNWIFTVTDLGLYRSGEMYPQIYLSRAQIYPLFLLEMKGKHDFGICLGRSDLDPKREKLR